MITLLLLSILPRSPEPLHCDLVELNTTYDGEGRETFKQTIAWHWNERTNRHECQGYQIVKAECQLPRLDCCSVRRYTAVWYEDGVARLLVADSYRETWTQCFDPEVADRELLPVESRRKLRGTK